MTAWPLSALPSRPDPRPGPEPTPLSARSARLLGGTTVVLLVAVVALQAADAATTSIVLGRGGVESNPLAAGLFGLGLTPWKLVPAVGLGAGWVVRSAWRRRSTWPALMRVLPVTLGVWLAVKVWVVAGNLVVVAHR